MSNTNSFNHLEITKQITGWLRGRRCRGIKAQLLAGEFPVTEQIAAADGSGKTALPAITVEVPSYIMVLADEQSIENPVMLESYKILSSHCLRTFRSFVVVAPRALHEEVRKKMKEVKAKPERYIWI